MLLSPRERYQKAIDDQLITADPAQRYVVEMLEITYQQLLQRSRANRTRFQFWQRKQTPISGCYIWGDVGRGKTFLMDLFYDSLPVMEKTRCHFHRFMQMVHDQLSELKHEKNPLEIIASRLAKSSRILCFDEFFVTDIADAMLLANLFSGLFARGVTLVATSNVEPIHLYKNGLQRERFLPTIDLLQQYTKIIELVSPTDYRLRTLTHAEIYHSPLDAKAYEQLENYFASLATEVMDGVSSIEINGRDIHVKALSDDVVWFEFAELCEKPCGQRDYIELAALFHAVLISNVPQFSEGKDDAARRFINLVDVFYDRKVKLILAAEVLLENLYQSGRLQFEFQRTQSRLTEMQSQEYLALGHEA